MKSRDDIGAILRAAIIRTPFPIAVDGVEVAEGDSGACGICSSRCSEKLCMSDRSAGLHLCPFGVRYHKFEVAGQSVTVYGLAPLDGGARRDASFFKGRKFPIDVINAWMTDLKEFVVIMSRSAAVARSEALDSLHDISRIASEVTSLANDLIRPSMDAGGGLDAAPTLHVSILKVSELLLKEFDRLELLINPASAATGKIYTHLYKLCHKYAQIIDLAYCKGNNKRIYMTGKSQNELRMYESISVLIFALIENAAKYSFSGERVEVNVNDGVGLVDVTVSSIGPLIAPEEVQQIFERGFRGKWARRSDQEGRGLGLHLAKIVADAHGVRISANSHSLGYERNSIPCARNDFSVRLRAI